MTDVDYRADAYLEQQVRDAVEEAFEDAECCMCDQLAVATATLLPCGHEGQYCGPHRKAVQRARSWHLKAGQSKACGICGVVVEAVAWGRL